MKSITTGVTAAFFVTCLGLGVSASVTDAIAASLSPRSGWEVTKIKPDDSSVPPYCAMSQTYTDETVLTIGRNIHEEFSLAIDFQSERLIRKHQYRLVVEVNPGFKRSFSVRPVSGNAIVVNFGKDKKLLTSLKKTSDIKMMLDGQTLQFSSKGLKSGARSLQDCLRSLSGTSVQVADTPIVMEKQEREAIVKPPRKGGALEQTTQTLVSTAGTATTTAAVGASLASAEASTSVVDKVTQMAKAAVPSFKKDPVKKLERENRRLSEALREERSRYEKVTKEGNSRLVEMEEKLSLMEKNKVQLQSALTQARTNATVPSAKDASIEVQSRMDEIVKERDLLKSKLDALEAEKKERATKKESSFSKTVVPLKTNMSEAELKDIEKAVRIQKKYQAQLDDMKKKMSALQKENDKLTTAQKNIETASKNVQEREDKIYQLKVALDKAISEKENLKTDLADLKKQQAVAKKDDVALASEELERAVRRYRESERENQRLGRLLEEERLRFEAEKVDLEETLFDPSLSEKAQRIEIAKMKKKIADLSGGKLPDIEKLRSENKQLKHQLITAQSNAERGADQTIDLENAALKKKNASLQMQLEKMQMAAKKDPTAPYKIELASLRKKVEGLDAEKQRADDLQKQLDAELHRKTIEGSKKEQAALMALQRRLAEEKRLHLQQKADMDRQITAMKGALEKSGKSEQQKKLAQDEQIQSLKGQLAVLQGQMQTQKKMQQSERVRYENQIMAMKKPKKAADPVPLISSRALVSPAKVEPAARKTAIAKPISSLRDNVKKLLTSIGLSRVVPSSGQHSVSWTANGMRGVAQKSAWRTLEIATKSYVKAEKSQCSGDFAASPSMTTQLGSSRMTGYDIACVGSENGSGTSVVFIEKQGKVTVISNHTSDDRFQDAMKIRDDMMNAMRDRRVSF